ncbi:MAG: hypothetical protein AAGH45_09860 [Pseudomonadota bacterium]
MTKRTPTGRPVADKEAKPAPSPHGAHDAQQAWRDLPFTPALFTVPMGLFGLGLLLRLHLWVPPSVSESLNIAGLIVCGGLVALFLTRLGQGRTDVATLMAPTLLPAWASFTITLLLLSGVLAIYDPGVAAGLWHFAAVLQFFVLLLFFRQLVMGTYDLKSADARWFLPTAGNMVAAQVGLTLPAADRQSEGALGLLQLAELSFVMGAITWVIILPIIIGRLAFMQPLPSALRPSLGILIAPPSLAYLIQHRLGTDYLLADGAGFFFMALFFALLALTLTKYLLEAPFSLAWWGLTFPLSIFAQAATIYAGANPNLIAYQGLALIAVAAATGITLLIAIRSGKAWAEGTLVRL